ncbi:MAG: nucleotidyltransferase family protein [Planktomarina sp.]|uniref:nucleotidyltransferase family protein n=1 Tax=Planktomarina sp. TaxID=2024851 RepID=UPI003C651D86
MICAAGASRRMAPDDKLMLPVQGRPLLRHLVKRVLQLSAPTLVVLPPEPHPRWQAVTDLPLRKISYLESAEGLSGTLRAAVADLPPAVTHLCVVLADLPLLEPVDFSQLFEQRRRHPDHLIWRPLSPDGQPAHPTLFHRDTFSAFAKISGDVGAKPVIDTFKSALHEFISARQGGSHDIDTRQDYETYLKTQA